MKRTFVYLSIIGILLLLPIAESYGRDSLSVRFKNVSRYPIYLEIYDRVCGSRVYRGRLASNATASASLCRGHKRKALVDIYNGRGWQLARLEILRARTIQLRLADDRRERPGR